MDFNKLFRILAVDLSGHGNNFKEMKSYTASLLANTQFNHVQLPSDFFGLLLNSGYVAKEKLGILYNIYANSYLSYEAKTKAFKDIEQFNFFNFSFEATKILKHIIESIIKYPVNSNETRALAAWIPNELRTGEMTTDHRACLMKLVNLKFIHATDMNILHAVFVNNLEVIKNIIDPGWVRIIGLCYNYDRNKMPLYETPVPQTLQRPSQISIHNQTNGQEPSPIEQYYVPRPYETEMIKAKPQWSPIEQTQPLTALKIPHFNSPIIPNDQNKQVNSPSYEIPSPTSLKEIQYDIPEKDVLSGVFVGECVIINIEKFTDPKFKNRVGSNKDAENIKSTFDAMGFHTIVKTDLRSAELFRYLKEKSLDQKLNKVGIFVCFLMSHGDEGWISGSDGDKIEIDAIVTNFKNNQCMPLQGKPKLFFVQACKESTVDVPETNMYTDDIPSTQPQDADLMICQTITKGNEYSLTNDGSWYVNKLCEFIRKGYRSLDLMQIHTHVNLALSRADENVSSIEVSNSSGSLRKTLRFVPNISAEDFQENIPGRGQDLFHRI